MAKLLADEGWKPSDLAYAHYLSEGQRRRRMA